MEVILLAEEEIPVPMEWEAEWTPTAGMNVWQDKKFLTCDLESNPDCLLCKQILL